MHTRGLFTQLVPMSVHAPVKGISSPRAYVRVYPVRPTMRTLHDNFSCKEN